MPEAYSETNYSSRHLINNRMSVPFSLLPMAEDVQRIVRELLEVTGLSQTEFGRKVGVSQSTVSKWLSGEHSPNLSQWKSVVQFAEKQSKTKDLLDSADAILAGLEPDDRAGALAVLRAHVAAIAKRKGVQHETGDTPQPAARRVRHLRSD